MRHQKLAQFWENICGSKDQFTLEIRIYHCFCFLALLAIVYHIPFNFFIGLPVSGLLSVVLLITQGYLYYVSRSLRKHQVSLLASGLLVHLVFFVNYYYNAGEDGPTDMLLILALFLLVAVSPPRMYAFWIVLNISIMIFLKLHEHVNPDIILSKYTNFTSRLLDNISAYIVATVLILAGLISIKRSYHQARKSAEDKAAALSEVNESKNKLFSIVSHDLRNPILSIKSYLELLVETDIEEADRKRLKKELLKLIRNTDQMLSNLLSWAQMQMQGINTSPNKINLLEAIGNTIEVYASLAKTKGIQFTDNLDREMRVFADPYLVDLVVRNLLANAVKFTRSGGEISISAELEGDNCKIIIRDTGVGIPENRQAELFGLTGKSTYGTSNEKGVGLGLMVSKEFIEKLNGRLWFESAEGEGSAFFIALPAARPESVPQA